MGKDKMPTVRQCLENKVLNDPKKEPVWVYLEKEMLANSDKKPYNEKVGRWLKFLKELRHHYYCEGVFKKRRLKRECGPRWYIEFSSPQREVLDHLKSDMHQDILAQMPKLVRRSLFDIGITLKFTKPLLLKAMADALEDPGLFMWYLYEAVYHVSPSKLLKSYDMNAKLIMSSLVFIDIKECLMSLSELTEYSATPKPVIKKKPMLSQTPACQYGVYLKKNSKIPLYSNNPSGPRPPPKPLPLGCVVKIKTKEEYTKLRLDLTCIEKRKERNSVQVDLERVCNYNFWEPPFRNSNANEELYAIKYRLLKKKPRKKYNPPLNNTQFQVAGVSYSGNVVNFILANVNITATGHIPINGGVVIANEDNVMHVKGMVKFPKKITENCVRPCKCLEKWENTAMDYIDKSKCKCGHFFDLKHEGSCRAKFFYPPTRYGPYWIDHAKVYQLNSEEDFIKDHAQDAAKSKEPTPKASMRLLTCDMSNKEILKDLLSNISNNALLIPHLPEASHLNVLLEWVRKRVKGKLSEEEKNKQKLVTQRRWLDLKHMDFRARAWILPFTLNQLKQMTWAYRDNIQELENILIGDYVSRNKLRQVEQAQLWWSTTKYDAFPGKPFLDTFFTYMPGRKKDTHLINANSKF